MPSRHQGSVDDLEPLGVTWVDVQVGDFNGDGKADIMGRAVKIPAWYVGLSNGSTAYKPMEPVGFVGQLGRCSGGEFRLRDCAASAKISPSRDGRRPAAKRSRRRLG